MKFIIDKMPTDEVTRPRSQRDIIKKLAKDNDAKYGNFGEKATDIHQILLKHNIPTHFLDSKIFIDYDKPKLFKLRQRIKFDYSIDMSLLIKELLNLPPPFEFKLDAYFIAHFGDINEPEKVLFHPSEFTSFNYPQDIYHIQQISSLIHDYSNIPVVEKSIRNEHDSVYKLFSTSGARFGRISALEIWYVLPKDMVEAYLNPTDINDSTEDEI